MLMSLNWKCLRGAGVLAAAVFAVGCYEIRSDVPAIADADRVAELPLTPGLYCGAEFEYDDDGTLIDRDMGDCFEMTVEGAEFTLTPTDEDEEPMSFLVADLGRGVSLLQAYEPDDDVYLLYVAVVREEGFAIVPQPRADAYTLEHAGDLAVALKIDAGDIEDLLVEDYEDQIEIRIAGGASPDVLAFLRDETGLLFDRGLRDEELGHLLTYAALPFVKTDASADEIEDEPSEATLDAAGAQLDVLHQAIGRAMALE